MFKRIAISIVAASALLVGCNSQQEDKPVLEVKEDASGIEVKINKKELDNLGEKMEKQADRTASDLKKISEALEDEIHVESDN